MRTCKLLALGLCCLLLVAACEAADDKSAAGAADKGGQKGAQAEVRVCPAWCLLAACAQALLPPSIVGLCSSMMITKCFTTRCCHPAHPPPLPPTGLRNDDARAPCRHAAARCCRRSP